MHTDLRTCCDNWTTPLAAAELLEIFATRPILDDEYRSFITETMTGCDTGTDRLAKPLLDTKAIIGTQNRHRRQKREEKDRSLDLTT